MARNYGDDYDRGGYRGGWRGGYGDDYSGGGGRGGFRSSGGDVYGGSGGYGSYGGSGSSGYGGGGIYGRGYGYGGGSYGGGSYGEGDYGGRSGGGREYGGYGYGAGGGAMEGRGSYGGYPDRYRSGYGGDYGSGGWMEESGGGEDERVRVSGLMTSDPETVTGDATLAEAAQKMRDLNVGIIPVVEGAKNKRLKGVITDRDIAVRAVAEGKDGNTKVSECMTSDVSTCNQNDSVGDVLRVMRDEQVRRVPITDRENRLVGIVAQADVASDWGGEGDYRDQRIAETLEEVSEPARPSRGRRG